MRESVASKAHRYLAAGRLTVGRLDDDTITASCRGDGAIYPLGWNRADRWWCECPARGDRCCHLVALRLVVVRDAGRWRRD